MTTEQIRIKVEEANELIEQIDELKGYIKQLTDGIMSKFGAEAMNTQSIVEYKRRIEALEKNLQQLIK